MFVSLFDTDLIFLFTDIYTQIFMLCCLKSMNHPLPLYATKLRPWFHPPPFSKNPGSALNILTTGMGGQLPPPDGHFVGLYIPYIFLSLLVKDDDNTLIYYIIISKS